MLAYAAACAGGKASGTGAAQQVRPEVKVISVNGVTLVTIDYN
jgi:hypothetical protein